MATELGPMLELLGDITTKRCVMSNRYRDTRLVGPIQNSTTVVRTIAYASLTRSHGIVVFTGLRVVRNPGDGVGHEN